MKILQILPELKSGGVERGSVDLAKYLVRQGHGSYVVSAGGPLVNDLSASSVIHYTLPVHRKSLASIFFSAQKLVKIIREQKIDLIHARSRVPAIIAFIVSRKTGVPFITTCHGFYKKHPFSYPMGWGKLVIAASHVIAKRMRDDFSVAPGKIRLIHRGVDLNEFPAKERSDDSLKVFSAATATIGVIGRLTPIKGHPFFFKAMARVARVYPGVRIQIIGDAPRPQYKQELITLTKKLGLAANVEFLGTRYDIASLLSKMDMLVIPSVGEEAFGRVAIEAGAVGVPVIATKMGGLVDVIESEKEGLLVSPDDPRMLADAVLSYLKDPKKARSFAENFQKRVREQFSLEQMMEKTLAVYKEALDQKRILVIKLSALGDVILSIPSLRALRQKYPNAWISVLVGEKARPILSNCPYINDVIVYRGDSQVRDFRFWLKTAKLLARESFDLVVDLQNNKISHLLAFLSSSPVRAGHKNGKWSFLLNKKAQVDSAIDPIEHQFGVLAMLGVESLDKSLRLWPNPSHKQKIDQFFSENWVSSKQKLVGINPGSSVRWQTKQWPLENFAKLCDELARMNIRVVITGSEEDTALAENLIRMTRNKPINAVGKTSILELTELIKRCDAYVTSDSAPMHIASGADTPLIALFGPTDPKRHFVPPTQYKVFWKSLQCSPCYLRTCPIGHICMNKITVAEVMDSLLAFCRQEKVAMPSPAVSLL